MNNQELIEKYEKLEGVWNANGAEIARQCFLRDLEQLNEIDTKKVTVPQFVADYIDLKKTYDFHVYGAMRVIEDHHDKRVQEWFYEGNIETFARAWLDGYEIEEEKRYLVKMKGVSEHSNYLNYDSIDDEWYLTDDENGPAVSTYHTRKQLEEAGFGEVFNSPLFEVEEV